jgi:hypothetical protein
MANLNEFRNRLTGGGARANQFKVDITSPFISDTNALSFLCRSASLPAMTIGEVPVFYRGRQIYVAGDRTFADWTVTVYNDGGWVARSNMENWNNALQEIGNSTVGAQDPSAYYGTIDVTQLDRSDNPLRTAQLVDAWPTNVGEIALAYDTVDAVEEFDVTFRFNYMQLGVGSTLGSGGSVRVTATF